MRISDIGREGVREGPTGYIENQTKSGLGDFLDLYLKLPESYAWVQNSKETFRFSILLYIEFSSLGGLTKTL